MSPLLCSNSHIFETVVKVNNSGIAEQEYANVTVPVLQYFARHG
jgi:hypothetical protein